MTRDEHMAWCKRRALEYVDMGDLDQAFASMASDVRKHPETADHPGVMLGMMMRVSGQLGTANAMRDFINGFH
jgi:hypothetical protein